jgi:hypothetical protein
MHKNVTHNRCSAMTKPCCSPMPCIRRQPARTPRGQLQRLRQPVGRQRPGLAELMTSAGGERLRAAFACSRPYHERYTRKRPYHECYTRTRNGSSRASRALDGDADGVPSGVAFRVFGAGRGRRAFPAPCGEPAENAFDRWNDIKKRLASDGSGRRHSQKPAKCGCARFVPVRIYGARSYLRCRRPQP